MEAFISPESLGLENIAVALLSQAEDRDQLSEMIYALVVAQLFMEMDPQAPEHIKYFQEGAHQSSVSLSEVEINQLVVEAVVASLEKAKEEVQAAHANHQRATYVLDKTKAKLIAKGNFFIIPIVDRIISKLKYQQNHGN